jgi:AcrR family transcriptional regulator
MVSISGLSIACRISEQCSDFRTLIGYRQWVADDEGPSLMPRQPPASREIEPKRRDRRHLRHEATRREILDSAWRMVRADGLASLSLRALARTVGVEPQSLYTYFASKNAVYDSMFGTAAAEFAHHMSRPSDLEDPEAALAEVAARFVAFCTDDAARYQLLFQRTIPGFTPTPEAFEPAERALEGVRAQLAQIGITDARHVDMWTAFTVGLVDQQLSNDPGGDRWSRLIGDLVTMFLSYCARKPDLAEPDQVRAPSHGESQVETRRADQQTERQPGAQ